MTQLNKFSLTEWLSQAQSEGIDFADFLLRYNSQNLDTSKDKILLEMNAMLSNEKFS